MTRDHASSLIDAEMAQFNTAQAKGDVPSAWRALERAHIISQPYLALHLANHVAMLGYAIEQRDGREVIGQLVRLALAPLGALSGRIPTGNTGRSNVSAFHAMPIPKDLADKMQSGKP